MVESDEVKIGPAVVEEDARTIAFPTSLALCLSGGGYRAALFHLGAVRRLNELGVLRKVDTISCVSGGSVLGAFLATRISDWRPVTTMILGTTEEWNREISAPFHALTGRNIRTEPLKRRFMPWNWFRRAVAVRGLAAEYEKSIGKQTLNSIPATPRFIFSATDLVLGVNWIFARDLVGDYVAGYVTTPESLSLARAVAASSCFPPVFDPFPIDLIGIKHGDLKGGRLPKDQAAMRKQIALNDGGNYDNFGLEPVWRDMTSPKKETTELLVSDGGGTFDYQTLGRWFWQRWQRYSSVQGAQGGRVRKRWLIERSRSGLARAAFWGINSAPERYASHEFTPNPGYSRAIAVRLISRIRTDLDAFSPEEAMILENHGYAMADAAVRRHLPHLPAADAAPYALPHPAMMDEQIVERALAESAKRKLLGRN